MYSEFLVNHYGLEISLEDARDEYPCSVLLHGNRTVATTPSLKAEQRARTKKRRRQRAKRINRLALIGLAAAAALLGANCLRLAPSPASWRRRR